MTEPATALTDFLLGSLALVFLSRLLDGRRVGAPLFFAGFAISAVLGGTTHGFFSGDVSDAQRFLWWLTIAFTGVAASGLVTVGLGCFGWRDTRALLLSSSIFSAAVASYAWSDPRFLVSVVVTGAGSVMCLAGLASHGRKHAASGAGWAMLGLVLSIVASLLQQERVAVHPVHFDHNATYHVFLIPALALFYAGDRRIAATP